MVTVFSCSANPRGRPMAEDEPPALRYCLLTRRDTGAVSLRQLVPTLCVQQTRIPVERRASSLYNRPELGCINRYTFRIHHFQSRHFLLEMHS